MTMSGHVSLLGGQKILDERDQKGDLCQKGPRSSDEAEVSVGRLRDLHLEPGDDFQDEE